MPQINKGGKFIFGKSRIRGDGTVCFPPQAIREYQIAEDGSVILFTGSKSTGGFCVTRRGLLAPSKLSHILTDNPALAAEHLAEGEFVRYKGRSYCWVRIEKPGTIRLTERMLAFLNLATGDKLLSIRSSDIAFTMGAKGPLLEKAKDYKGDIEEF